MAYYEAVIMAAGHGSRLPQLAMDIPKCLLPVANQPMIWYPIKWLQKQGLKKAFIVVERDQSAMVSDVLNAGPLEDFQLEFVMAPDDLDTGTADSLKEVSKLTKKSMLLVLSCDLITDLSLFDLEFFHFKGGSFTSFLAPKLAFDEKIPGEGNIKDKSRDQIFRKTGSSLLIYYNYTDAKPKPIQLPDIVHQKVPNISQEGDYADQHLYLINRPILDYLEAPSNDQIHSFRKEFIYKICLKQFEEHLVNPKDHPKEQEASELLGDPFSFGIQDRCDTNPIVCNAYRRNNVFSLRVDNLTSFMAANSRYEDYEYLLPKDDQICPSTQRDSNIIADSAIIDPKTTFIKTNIGGNTVIECAVRLTNCIIHEEVKIEQGCILSNCVVLAKAVIKKYSKLTGCIIGADYIVDEKTTLKDKTLHREDL